MGRVERKHYPASKLPPELRGEIGLNSLVTVTVEETSPSAKPLNGVKLRDFLIDARSKLAKIPLGEGVERIRALRNEWDD